MILCRHGLLVFDISVEEVVVRLEVISHMPSLFGIRSHGGRAYGHDWR